MKTKIFNELSSQDFERLLGRALNDGDCINAFMDIHAEEFGMWIYENGIDNDYACDHEMDYIECREEEFGEFATVYYNAKGK